MSESVVYKRTVRSFVRREGRLTPSQRLGIEQLMENYGGTIEDGSLTKWVQASTKLVLEIGFGMGEGLYAYASQNPDTQFLGIEVHRPGVGRLLNQLSQEGLTNVRVCMQDAKEVIEQALPAECLDRVQIFFPDPWPKKKHHKRRIIQTAFIQQLMTKLKPEGVIHLATDWEDYYHHMVQVMEQEMVLVPSEQSAALISARPKTRFEQRGIRLGHAIYDLVYRKPLKI